MAYDSTRNYAQEIQDLIAAGGDPAVVNQILNERLEKQQSTQSEYSTYDDVYRSAMDYMASKGYKPKAGANVNYAEIANQILMDQDARGVGSDFAGDRSWADLGTVLDAQKSKLDTGEYDKYKHSKIGDSDITYESLLSILQQAQEMSYQQLRDKHGQGQGKVVMTPTGYVGSGAAIGWGNDPAYDSGSNLVPGGVRITNGIMSGAAPGSNVKVVNGTPGKGAVGGADWGYSDEAWQKKQLRDSARDLVGETNAATRVPVQGENSSYVKANTNNAFEQAAQALLQGEDQEGANLMKEAWDRYGASGLVDILMPQVRPDGRPQTGGTPAQVYGVYGGGTKTGTVPQQYIADPNDPFLNTAFNNRAMGANPYYYELTDAQRAALDQLAAENGDAHFTFSGTEFDQGSLGSTAGDVAVREAAKIIASGGGGGDGRGSDKRYDISKDPEPDAGLNPVKPRPTLSINGYGAPGKIDMQETGNELKWNDLFTQVSQPNKMPEYTNYQQDLPQYVVGMGAMTDEELLELVNNGAVVPVDRNGETVWMTISEARKLLVNPGVSNNYTGGR